MLNAGLVTGRIFDVSDLEAIVWIMKHYGLVEFRRDGSVIVIALDQTVEADSLSEAVITLKKRHRLGITN